MSVYLEGESEGHRPLELVTVNADTRFEFPSAEFFKDLEDFGLGLDNSGETPLPVELGPFLSSSYRGLLNVLALPFSPMGSQGLLEEQVSEISRRFRRYKNQIYGMALDDEDDLLVPGYGVDPLTLGKETSQIDIFTDSEVKKKAFRHAKSLTWTETGDMVEGLERNQIYYSRERLGTFDSAESSMPNIDKSDNSNTSEPDRWNPDLPENLARPRVHWSPDVPWEDGEIGEAKAWSPDEKMPIAYSRIKPVPEEEEEALVEI